ncbi:hypothetical protein D3C83_171020 [compost metagenome]
MIALNDCGQFQTPDAGEARAGGKRDPVRERLVGESPLGLQLGENPPVDPV